MMHFLKNANLIKLAGHFEGSGYQIRVVGGAVRDAVAGVQNKDIDLCTDATPAEMQMIGEKFKLNVIETGLAHGTLTFVIGGEPFEVTTLRVDKETDGRHAVVEFTRSFEADASRRDLTINAMSMDMDGNLYDYFNGKKDLSKNRLRFVGNARQRVEEDYLRVLRYFRFKAKINDDDLEDTLRKVFCEPIVNDGIAKLSGERIWSELKKTIMAPFGMKAIRGMYGCGALSAAMCGNRLSTLVRLSGTAANQIRLLQHVIQAFPNSHDRLKEVLVMGVVAAMTNRHSIEFILDRLRVSAQERKDALAMCKFQEIDDTVGWVNHSLETAFFAETAGGADPYLWMAFLLSRDLARNIGVIDIQLGVQDKMSSDGKVVFHKDMKPFTITGKDLIDIGVKPGKVMGDIIRSMRMQWAQNACTYSKQDMIKKIMDRFPDPSKIFSVSVVTVTNEQFFASDLTTSYVETRDEEIRAFCKKVFVAEDGQFAKQIYELGIDSGYMVTMFFKDKQTAMLYKLSEELMANAHV